MQKVILLDERAKQEIIKFPKEVRIKIRAYVEILQKTGELKQPFAKKIKALKNLYEIRAKYQGSWRVFYAYQNKEIIILSAFHKKSQKTPTREINKAIKRFKEYQ